MKEQKPLRKSIRLWFTILIGLVVYAYGFYVTDVNFKTTQEAKRITALTRILRALVHPNIFEYEKEELNIEIPFYLPCPEGGTPAYEPDSSGPYLVFDENCAEPQDTVQIEGYNFWPNAKGPINFIPLSGATLQIGNLSTDSNGYFSTKVTLPNREPVEEVQTVRATARRNVGPPRFTQMAKATWDKILETIFLALLATTFGTLIAIPISFLAARNLMVEVKSSLTSIALSIIGWPIGIALGGLAAQLINLISAGFMANMSFGILGVGVIASPVVIWFAARWAIPRDETKTPSLAIKISRGVVLLLCGILAIFFLFFLAKLLTTTGESLGQAITALPFISNFIYQIGEIIQMFTTILVAFAVGGALGSYGGQIGQTFSDNASAKLVKGVNIILAAIAGALLFAILGAVIDWFYQIGDLAKTLFWPGGIGAAAGIALVLFVPTKDTLPMGSVIYYITRTILNGTRSVEPLVMVIVFVVWVGIGPFAGALALGLHTVAALAKLFSEQVESILPGPLEAIRASGANRLQTIVYAVVPQIVPPYISFTMYRWDINVRMSTIIGFAGGGGIGFLLQQNIGLLHYRDASVQMLAIAITVASMDYISSVMRERFV